MKNLRSGLLVLGLVSLICLFAPSSMLAQEDGPPPCCYSHPDMVSPDLIIIIIDVDETTPSEEGATPDEDTVSEIASVEPNAVLPDMVADTRRVMTIPRELFRPTFESWIRQS